MSLRRAIWMCAGLLCVLTLLAGAPAFSAWAQDGGNQPGDNVLALDQAGFGMAKHAGLPGQESINYTVALQAGDNLAIDLQPEADAIQVSGVAGPGGAVALDDAVPGSYNVRALATGDYQITVANTGDTTAGFVLRVLVTYAPLPTDTLVTLENKPQSVVELAGQPFQVALPMSERSPGEWAVKLSEEGIVAQDGEPSTLIYGTMPGAASEAIFQFQALALGSVELTFTESGDTATGEPRVLNIEVQAAVADESSAEGLGAAQDGALTATLGSTILVPLAGNPTTGYVWQVAIGDEQVLAAAGDMVFTPNSDLAGAPGVETFRFQAVGLGQTTLTFGESRPWETDVPPLQKVVLTVTVIEDAERLGRDLVTRYLDAVQAADKDALRAMLSPAFQVVRTNGAVDDATTYLDNLPVVEKYSIDQLRATRAGDVLVVTYMNTVDATADGADDFGQPAPRMTVFQQVDGEWELLAHANLTPMQ